MTYRKLGGSGLHVSALGLGTNAFGKRTDEEESIRIIHAALDSGITFMDTANIYAGTRSETIIGKALAGRRSDAVLTTKAGLPTGDGPGNRGASRSHLLKELEGSLRRLGTDYVDLYQIHTFDPDTPLEETLRTLDDMVRSGKVRYIGASNYQAWELMKALGISDRLQLEKYVSIQTSYSLADRTPELELVPLCLDQGIGLIPYFPLAGGILTGKYAAGADAPSGSRLEKDSSFGRLLKGDVIGLGQDVMELAEEAGCEPAALSIRWLMDKPAVSSVIAGATSVSQLEANLRSLELAADPAIQDELERISRPFRYGEPFARYRI
ncbi:aldo/keto reductase [Paenibacillus herberti]|uniref:Aldo/keto reductase n=1 Tax=Paenibacillus herberti TaxID=1619309 RepID=A0A229NVA9_9BACL|nr:aldo/keto reductase [Paenibacillus herberti]OXM13831.1 aldo/keto reductase [Paenibacillus herberti]